MKVRRGFALGIAVVALATVTPSAAATAAAGKAKPTICVALVVDGRALGSDVSTACATVPRGATGIDVLEAAGHRVGFRGDGLLCTIDGLPKTGCADIDDSHYWAYFHRAPGSTNWVYSSEGPSTYQPVNDSAEGWVFDDGSTLTPKNVPYATICKANKASPSAHPTTTPARGSPSAGVSVAATPHATKPAGAHHHSTPRSDPSTTARPATAVVPSPSASSSAQQLAGAVGPAPHHRAWLGLVIGLILVLGLGGLAALRFRRSARGSE
jgi:hypothetical protein